MTNDQIIKLINPMPESDYSVNVRLSNIDETLNDYHHDMLAQGGELVLIPDFQRGHVWTLEQQIHYVENYFRHIAPRNIKFVTGRWLSDNGHDDYMKNMYCLDGLQRLTALRQFVAGAFKIFGEIGYSDMTRSYLNRTTLIIEIYVTSTREETLRLYLDLNSGGTPHCVNEIERVRGLLNGKG